MTLEKPNDDDLPFRPDFATRVLAEADAISVRRRKIQDAVAGLLTALALGAVLFGSSLMWMRSAPEDQRVPRLIAGADPTQMPFRSGTQTTLLDFMFPHAAAVARFSDAYGAGNDPDALEDDAVFFPEAQSVAESDS